MINCNSEKLLISPKTIVEKYNIEKKNECSVLYSKYIRHFNENYIYDGNVLYVIYKLSSFPELNDPEFVIRFLNIFSDAGYKSMQFEKLSEDTMKFNCTIDA